jgi:hypothetical protein
MYLRSGELKHISGQNVELNIIEPHNLPFERSLVMDEPRDGHKPLEDELEEPDNRIDYKIKYRESYPGFISRLLAISLFLGGWLVLHLFEVYLTLAGFLMLAVAAVAIAALWQHDSNRELRRHVPPSGWKSVIKPDELVNMELADFDTMMRFRLKGDKNDPLENHRVRWASRYSRDVIHITKALMVIAFLCPLGAVLLPEATVTWSNRELPHTYHLVLVWLVVALVILILVALIRFDWRYRMLMLDETFLYFLFEVPAWLPWPAGQRDPIRLSTIISADPQDTTWGKRNGHGTVVLTYMRGIQTRTKTLRRVPQHHDFSDAVNSARDQGGTPMGMGMMY